MIPDALPSEIAGPPRALRGPRNAGQMCPRSGAGQRTEAPPRELPPSGPRTPRSTRPRRLRPPPTCPPFDCPSSTTPPLARTPPRVPPFDDAPSPARSMPPSDGAPLEFVPSARPSSTPPRLSWSPSGAQVAPASTHTAATAHVPRYRPGALQRSYPAPGNRPTAPPWGSPEDARPRQQSGPPRSTRGTCSATAANLTAPAPTASVAWWYSEYRQAWQS